MDLYFLGTGAGLPSKQRNVSSIALQMLQERGATWLFDCGESTQHQILHTNIRPRRIEKIFITHLHGDHIFGLPGLIGSRSFQGGTTPLYLYGPKGLKSYIQTTLQVSGTHITYDLVVIEIEDEGIVYEDQHIQVLCTRLEHGLECFGYRVQEKDKPGELQAEKLKEAGIQPGPIYQKIKENEVVTLENGKKIRREDFVGPTKKGQSVSILGDTRYLPHLSSFIKESDILVHEATFSKEEPDIAYQYFHSTTEQAAKLAQSGHVKNLVLTHISSRYQKKDIEMLLEEAQAIFPNTKIANDFDQFSIPRPKEDS